MPSHLSGLGSGAVCSVYLRYLHPRDVVKAAFINLQHGQRQDDLLALRMEEKRVNKRMQECVVFRSEAFSCEVYCVKRFVKVTSASPPTDLFNIAENNLSEQINEEAGGNEAGVPTPRVPHGHGTMDEAIRIVRAAGLDVDDDNEPAPENIPPATINNEQLNNPSAAWGWSGFCERRMSQATNGRARLNGLSGVGLACVGILTMWQTFAPIAFFQEVILKAINQNITGYPVSWGEFLRWLGLWYLMASEFGNGGRRDYWSMSPIDRFDGAPFRLDDLMSRKRFESILKAIRLTDKEPPVYKDRFCEIRELLASFNNRMKDVFVCGYLSCLDESMSAWTNQYSCPGWMFVPRKPHPMGNEYHTICCALSCRMPVDN